MSMSPTLRLFTPSRMHASLVWRASVVLIVLSAGLVTATSSASALDARPKLATKQTLANLICEGDGSASACSTCPSYTSFEGESADGNANLGPFFVGSFVTPGATEAYVGLTGCEPHGSNYQGAVLLRKTSTTWKFVRYDAGIELDSCLSYRYASGTDLLVCEGGWFGQGYGITYVNATYIGPKSSTQRSIVRAQSNEGTCDAISDFAQVSGFAKRTEAKREGLEVIVAESHAKRTGGSSECPEGNNGKVVTHTLQFTFDGKRFTAQPSSAATVTCLGSFVDGKGKSGTYCPPVG
jgi:hypothetical protein